MTVAELRKNLEGFPDEMIVAIYYDGYMYPIQTKVEKEETYLNDGKPFLEIEHDDTKVFL